METGPSRTFQADARRRIEAFLEQMSWLRRGESKIREDEVPTRRERIEAYLQQMSWLRRGMSNIREDEVPTRRADVLTRAVFFAQLREDMRAESGIFMLPLVILLLALFTSMVIGHERSIARQSLRSAIRDDILENCNYDLLNESIGFMNMDNVKAAQSVNDWMRLGFFEHLLWKTASMDGNLTGRYLQYNRIVGGVRLLTQRMDESVARCGSSIAEMFQTPCVLEKIDDRSAEGYDDLAFAPDGEETSDWSAGPGFEPSAIKVNGSHRIEWFMMSQRREEQEEKLAQLIRNSEEPFFDRKTQHVMLSMILFNADLQLICLVESNFFFSRTGRVWPLLRIKTIDPDPFHQPILAVCDICFFILMFTNCFRDFRLVYIYWKEVGFKNLMINLPHGPTWYFLDVVGFTCSFVLFVTFLDFYREATGLIYELEVKYTDMSSDQDVMASFLRGVEETAHTTLKPYRTALLVYPFSLMMRLTLGFSGNPRLSMVTRVFKASFSDLVHYLIVFMSFFLCFTIFALLMFGREVKGYSTMLRSLQSNIQMMFGDVDWEELNTAGFVRAVILYWAFHIGIVMLMFNILVAIILDTYENLVEEMGKSTKPQTLVAQVEETYMRLLRIWSGDILDLGVIWMACVNDYGDQILSAEPFTQADLMETLPQLTAGQAEELFRKAELRLTRQTEQDGPSLPLDMQKISRLWDMIDSLLDTWPVSIVSQTKFGGMPATIASPVPFLLEADAPPPTGVPESVGLPADVERFLEGSGLHPVVRLESLAGALQLAEWLSTRAPDSRGGVVLNPKVAPAIRLAMTLVREKMTDKSVSRSGSSGSKRRGKSKGKAPSTAEIAVQTVDDVPALEMFPTVAAEPRPGVAEPRLETPPEPRRRQPVNGPGAQVWRRLVERGNTSGERDDGAMATDSRPRDERQAADKPPPTLGDASPGDAVPSSDEEGPAMEHERAGSAGSDDSPGIAVALEESVAAELQLSPPPGDHQAQMCCI